MKRRTRVILIVTAVIATLVVASTVAAVTWARDLQDAANTGKDQAEAGARSLGAEDATAAVSQFRAAAAAFTRAQELLGPDWVGGAAAVIPWAGRQYGAAKTLVAIGLDVSTAGTELSAVLLGASAETTTSGSTRLGAVLSTGKDRIDTALVALGDAAERAAGLSEDGLDPRLAKAVRSLKDALSGVAPFLDRSRSFLALERFLLSAPHRILVISQDSAELRPTGGFAGSYGILDVGPQGFSLEKYTDVYTLPHPLTKTPHPPGAIMAGSDFGFRDANWWIDFPTSAKTMLSFWDKSGQKPVDGIIAIDLITVRNLLETFGPVTVPSYGETFTAQNLIGRLLYLIEVKSGGLVHRKDVLVALAGDLEERILSAGPKDLAHAVLGLAKSGDAKHVQMYFLDAGAETAVTGLGWSGAIAPPIGTTDLLVVSNAMNLPGKVNIAMRKTIGYEVALSADGSADTTLVLAYANTAPAGFPFSRSVFRDYLRVYRAPGTILTPGVAVSSSGATTTVENGLPTVVRTFEVLRGASHTETIVTRVPGAWTAGIAVPIPRSPAASSAAPGSLPGSVSHYRLFIVRQADLEDVPTSVSVTAPQGWRISGVTAWKTASGEALNTFGDEGVARLSLPLDADVVLDVVMERR